MFLTSTIVRVRAAGRRRHRVLGPWLAVLAVGGALLGSVPAASAAPAWLNADDLSAGGEDAGRPQVALDGHGDAAAVWVRSNGANNIVQAAFRPAGGTWQTPRDLSAPGQNTANPQVGLDDRGDTIAVWDRFDGSNEIVQAAVRPAATGAWQTPQDLSSAGQNAIVPRLSVDGQGDAVAVWQRFDGTHAIVQAAARQADAGFGAAQDLSAAGQDAFQPDVALDRQGDAIAIWERSDGTNFIVQTATRTAADAAWQTPQAVSAAGQNAFEPQVAVDGQGDATAIWVRADGKNDIVQAAVRRAATASWETPQDLSAAGQNAISPDVAVDGQGTAVAVWDRFDGSNDIVQAAVRPAGAGFGAAQDLTAAGQDADLPRVTVDGRGDAIAVWERPKGTDLIVQAATRTAADAAWQIPLDLSAAGHSAFTPQVAVDGQGDAIAVWARSDGMNNIVQAAGHDGAGPLLQELSVPATGTAGAPVSFSVSPLDAWSALGVTSWSFGDGATATGAMLTHTFATPGTFTADVTATDALGNATSASRTITITPAAAPPRPPVATAAVAGLRLSRAAFRAARSGPPIKAASAHTGTRVSYTLNVAARVRFTIQRARRGRRVNGRCITPTRANRKHSACIRFAAVRGSLSRNRLAGNDRFTFTGRLPGRALRPGHYRLTATPTASGHTGSRTSASFTIVK
jgi:hypothetical protein